MQYPVRALGLTALALCATWCTSCQSNRSGKAGHDATQEQIFAEVDEDSDGHIDREEFVHYFYVISFDQLDVDSNDRLTLVEWVGPRPDHEYEVVFDEMDTDHSGWLVFSEYSAHPLRTVTVTNAFMTIDRNGDELVELDELDD